MNENETGATVNHEEGNNNAAARRIATDGLNYSYDLFGSSSSDSDDATPAQGGTTATATAVPKGNGAAKAAVQKKRKEDKLQSQPPKLNGRYASLKPTIASQPLKLQWTMFTTTKNMLEHEEEIQKRLDGFRRNSGNYFDKHDLDADGKPTEKPFVPGSLRCAPLLNCSKIVKNDDRVREIYAQITTELDAGNKTLLDEYKNKLSVHAKNISELEVKARKKLQAHDYHTAAKRIAGALTIIAKRSEQFADPESTSENIAYAAVAKATGLYQKEHLKGLAFATQNATDNEGDDPREGEL